jgi:hypothetical protein
MISDKNRELMQDMKDEDGNYVIGNSVYDEWGNYLREKDAKETKKIKSGEDSGSN